MEANTPHSSRFLTRWPAEVARGRTSFVLRQGLTFIVFMLAVNWLASRFLGWNDIYAWGQMPARRIFIQLVFLSLGGLFVGLMVWTMNNRRYKKLTAHNASSPG